MKNYEKIIEENEIKNKKYISEFEKWLKEKKLTNRTVIKHLNNAELYINDYLNYYEAAKAEEGINNINSFLGNWFIEKCLWASKGTLKETASSIKKFYQYMSEYNYIKKEDYKLLCDIIKKNMESYLEELERFDEGDYWDYFD